MTWVGWQVGMSGPTVQAAKRKLKARYSYAKQLDEGPYFTPELEAVLKTYAPKRNAEGWQPPVRTDGILDYNTQDSLGMIAHTKPIMFTVEGHMSDMFSGPVADTAAQLEREGVCRHQPIGYNCTALPFDNNSGISELARLIGSTKMDNGTPFPAGTPWSMGIFSQGGIVGSYFYFNYLQDGQPLAWRRKDLKGVLAYGNPCRGLNRVSPWAQAWIRTPNTHGLDPYHRFDMPGHPATPDNWMECYREGDIFAQNGDDEASQMKAAIYQAVQSDFFSNPFSLAAKLAKTFQAPIAEIIPIIQAIISGVGFLAQNPSPHYSPFELTGGINWMRQRLTTKE